MADLSPVAESFRHQVEIIIQPWFRDHGFAGKIILPAVETLLIMGREVEKIHRNYNIATMLDAGFGKFLPIGPNDKKLPVLVEVVDDDNDKITAKLFSRVRKKTFSRLLEHGRVTFKQTVPHSLPPVPRLNPSESLLTVSAEIIYRKLVPFGPAYQNIIGELKLTDQGAWGKARTPYLSVADPENCGSPFIFDAAMHAASVWGQSFADFVPFPVGFVERVITKPTRAGEVYDICVVPTEIKPGEQLYNVWISCSGKLFEYVEGMKMRDVGGGKPPT